MNASMSMMPNDPEAGTTTAEGSADSARGSRYVVRRLVVASVVGLIVVLAAAWIFFRSPSSADLPELDLKTASADVRAAILAAREEVIADPDSAQAWGRLAMLLRAHDFGPEANRCFAEAERLEPRDFRWPYLRGVGLAVMDRQGALDCYRRAVELRGSSVFARLRLAELLIDVGRFDEAKVQLDAALELEPDSGRAMLGLARLADRRGDLQESLRWGERSAALAPMKRGTHELLARIHHRQGDRDAAAEQLAILKEIPEGETTWNDPLVTEVLGLRQDSDSTLIRAERLLEQGRTSQAIAILEELVSEQSAVAKYHYELARALVVAGDNTRAAQRLERAIEQHPGSAEMRRLLGIVHYSQHQWEPAAERFRQAIELKPDDSVAYYNLGHCLVRLERRDEALTAFRNAVHVQPDSADAHTNVGKLLLESGRRREAVEHLRLAVQFAPDDPAPRELLNIATAE